MNILQKFLNLSVAREMAFLSISIGILYAVISTAIQVSFEYEKEEAQVEELINSIISSNKNSLSHALWEFHDDLIHSLLTGILIHPQISQVKIIDINNNKTKQIIKTKPKKSETKTIDLIFNSKKIGTLNLEINYDQIHDKIYAKAQKTFISNVIESLLLTLLILFFLKVKVSRPLYSLTVKAQSIVDHFSKEDKFQDQEAGKKEEKNEIRYLDETINIMHNAILSYIHDVVEAHKKLKTLNRDLEYKVATRTKEINNKNKTLEKSLNQIQKTQKQLVAQEKMASLGAITSGIAHEINNPLNFIINAAIINNKLLDEVEEALDIEKLLEDKKDEDSSENFKSIRNFNVMIKDHGHRIDSIVKSMLSLSRKGSPAIGQINLPFVIKEVLNITYKSHKKIHLFELNLIFNMPEELHFYCFQHEFTRALVAIFENSHYALRKKFEQNKTEQPRFEITLLQREKDLDLIFYDNGEGIGKEDLEQAFTPFFTTKPAGSGTGLGLSTVYEIITEIHKGRITIDSIKGEFTRVIISLPILKESD